ncbi:MAG: hypothetical protein QOJ20_3354 [Mycobacterium sp.]|nr:hypothetical protein [Mycobacterium sp.]
MADDYARHALSQRASFEATHPAVMAAAGRLASECVLRVADLGAADGVNSHGLIRDLVAQRAGRPLIYALVDLPTNAWRVALKHPADPARRSHRRHRIPLLHRRFGGRILRRKPNTAPAESFPHRRGGRRTMPPRGAVCGGVAGRAVSRPAAGTAGADVHAPRSPSSTPSGRPPARWPTESRQGEHRSPPLGRGDAAAAAAAAAAAVTIRNLLRCRMRHEQ